MRYKIIYDKPGRLRVRMGQYAFNKGEGYGIETLFLAESAATSVEASSVNGGILICYKSGGRDRIIEILDKLNKNHLPVAKPQEVNHIREMDDEFFSAVFMVFSKHYIKKWFVPAPVRILLTVFNATRFWKKGLSSLINFNVNVDVLDSAAILTSMLQKDFSAASSIMSLLRVSELLEDYTRKKAKQSLAQNFALNIDCLWMVDGDDTVLTPVSKVKIGDIIRVYTGAVIPLDGEVFSGEALVNEASMTGEALAVHRTNGDSVFAGTVLEEGSIDIRVRTLADNTRIQNIVSLIDNSENLKAAIQGKAEQLADSIVPFSFLAAAGTFLLTGSAAKASSVLMVDYSCAIKLTTPICIISAMHEAAKHRILVKGGKYLEAYANADTIVFDKTGTLTEACPKVAKVIPFGGLTRDETLKISACLEEHFPHSVAKAIVRQAEIENLGHREEHAKPEYIVAHGISSTLHGERVLIGSMHFIAGDEGILITKEQKEIIDIESNGYSAVFLAVGGKLAGMICIDDPVRTEAKDILNELRQLGIKHIIMLTGDSEAAAKCACEQLGITEYFAGVLPDEKADAIRKLKEQGHTVIMVGDGINDSPALSHADVSVAMRDGSDIAKEVADISLLSESLDGLVTLRRMSHELIDKIHKNYRSIMGFNTSLLVLGVAGIIQPSTSAVLHNASTMLLCGDSMKQGIADTH